eukprot:CAMPEP_0178748166 /NCGR_PEP_ID=MMETSP0744-20121128/8740_1 /TAXON_ID=913974 /ORGANISM="Nitzschia punctata, Strain CCMP561" /LENGTH=126 /DNA_ID=CAMNT_0020401511 /DNA_START=99 /DNA_END=479 /DNA_ORIENTATION=+
MKSSEEQFKFMVKKFKGGLIQIGVTHLEAIARHLLDKTVVNLFPPQSADPGESNGTGKASGEQVLAWVRSKGLPEDLVEDCIRKYTKWYKPKQPTIVLANQRTGDSGEPSSITTRTCGYDGPTTEL